MLPELLLGDNGVGGIPLELDLGNDAFLLSGGLEGENTFSAGGNVSLPGAAYAGGGEKAAAGVDLGDAEDLVGAGADGHLGGLVVPLGQFGHVRLGYIGQFIVKFHFVAQDKTAQPQPVFSIFRVLADIAHALQGGEDTVGGAHRHFQVGGNGADSQLVKIGGKKVQDRHRFYNGLVEIFFAGAFGFSHTSHPLFQSRNMNKVYIHINKFGDEMQ